MNFALKPQLSYVTNSQYTHFQNIPLLGDDAAGNENTVVLRDSYEYTKKRSTQGVFCVPKFRLEIFFS